MENRWWVPTIKLILLARKQEANRNHISDLLSPAVLEKLLLGGSDASCLAWS